MLSLRRFVALSIEYARRLAVGTVTRHSSYIVSVRSAPDKREVTIEDETRRSYPLPYAYIWEERQRKTSSLARDDVDSSSSRLQRRWTDDVIVSDIQVSRDRSQVTVVWSSGDRTTLSIDWLMRNWNSPGDFVASKRCFWGSEYCGENIFKFQFRRLLDDNRYLIEFVSKLGSHGMVILEGAKAQPNELVELGKRLGGSKCTSYGYDN